MVQRNAELENEVERLKTEQERLERERRIKLEVERIDRLLAEGICRCHSSREPALE
jgi:hypothetical protein